MTDRTGDQTTPTDPTEQYDQPGAEPRIEHPGHTDEMRTEPDHGEESYVGSGRLEGRRAVITGGDSGIGRAVAIAFAREGADVLLSYLPEEADDAEVTAGHVRDAGRRAVLVPGDLRDEAHCTEVIQRAVAERGGIDVLVVNAAYQMAQEGGLLDITTEQLDRVMKRLGEAPPADGPGAVIEWQDGDCVSFSEDGSTLITGWWGATYAPRPTPYGMSYPPFGVVVQDGRVSRVEVVTDGLATEAGVQVGDSLDDVRSAYPDATLVGHVDASGIVPGRDVWAVVDDGRMLAFEVTTDEPSTSSWLVVNPGIVAAIVASQGTTYPDGTVALGLACS